MLAVGKGAESGAAREGVVAKKEGKAVEERVV